MGLRRAIIEQVFKVKQIEGIFADADNAYYASATAVTQSPIRKGQIIWGSSAGTKKIYLAIAATGTTAAAWLDITN